jgi:hypothetical protein
MNLNIEKLSEMLSERRESFYDNWEAWLDWCDENNITDMQSIDVEDFWSDERCKEKVCVDIGPGSGWLLVPKELAEKFLILGIP